MPATAPAAWELDLATGRLTWSPRHFALLRLPPAEDGQVDEALWRAAVAPPDRARLAESLAQARRGRAFRLAYRLQNSPDGAEHWVESLAGPLRGGEERVVGLTIGLSEGWTGAEEQRQAQKLQALGRIAAGVSHDLDNVLQEVTNRAWLIGHLPKDAAVVRENALAIGDAAARGACITRRVLSFVRHETPRRERLSPASLLHGLRHGLASLLGGKVILEVGTEADLPPVLAERAALETALINLVANARDAMPGGGTVRLTAALETVPGDGRDGPPTGLAPGRYVRIDVADEGGGMTEEVLVRAGQPFFTTKPAGAGTGLGLAMVRGVAEASGGAFALRSAAGRGTSAILWLPATEPEPEADALPHAAGAAGRSLLVVDDDPDVLRAMTALLRAQGHQVHPAGDAAAALALLRGGAVVDLLLTDLTLPGMQGSELICEARRHRPGLPAVVITGHVDAAAAGLPDGMAPPVHAVLPKPISGNELSACIKRVLGGGAGSSASAA